MYQGVTEPLTLLCGWYRVVYDFSIPSEGTILGRTHFKHRVLGLNSSSADIHKTGRSGGLVSNRH